MATILVTGGAGYIGSHTCKALARAGHVPVCYDNLQRGQRGAVRWGPLEIGDILDTDLLKRVIEHHRPDAVIHFAALASVPESIARPQLYYLNNVAGTLSLLEATTKYEIAPFVFSSTCAVYGAIESLEPVAEDMPLHPINPYGRTKRMMEETLLDYAATGVVNPMILRYFNAAGCDPEGELGDHRTPVTAAIPLLIETLRGAREVFEVLGTDYPTRDGSAVRDYIHVSDLADAHVKAVEYLLAGNKGVILNLGTETGTSVKELIKAAESATGLTLPVKESPRRAGDPAFMVANASRAKKLLGWTPACSGMDTIIRTAYHQRFA